MSFTRDDLMKLLQLVDITAAEEIDCSEFMHRVSGYLERLGPDGQPPQGYEDVIHHLQLCPECLEEFEALYEAFCGES